MSNTNEDIPAFARNAINLASAGLGAKPTSPQTSSSHR